MRILAILIMSMTAMTAMFAVEWTEADLPEDSSEDTNDYIAYQMKILEEAQEDLVKLRERLIRSLERDLRKYERKDDDKAVAAIKALIEAQKEALSLMEVGRQVVDSGLPVDPENDIDDIFDTRSPEERRKDYEAQREFNNTKIGGRIYIQISEETINLIVDNEVLSEYHLDKWNRINMDASILKKLGPIINHENVFKSLFPESYKKGCRSKHIGIYNMIINGNILKDAVDKKEVESNLEEFNILDFK